MPGQDADIPAPRVYEPRLILYGHNYCHLCAEMQLALQARQARDRFVLELVDIEGRPELERRFGEKVPVLFCEDREVCHYFLDETALADHLRTARRARGRAAVPAGDR